MVEYIYKIYGLILIVTISGCATPILYKKAGAVNINGEAFRTGYSDDKISLNRFHVKFQGNGQNSTNDVYKKFLRRAAEVTIENKHKWFLIENTVHGIGGYGALSPWPNYEGDVIFVPSGNEKTFNAEDILKNMVE